ncbi:MAG: hypothetical protein IBJ17_19850 [Reyranella sp.]|nr:hypothetical protein [Reyranella sp.]
MQLDYKGLPLTLTAGRIADPGDYGTWPLGTAAWTWDPADDPGYTPQGITSFQDTDTAKGTKQEVVLVSWHSAGDKPPRLSYLVREGDDWRYGNVLLQGADVTPKLHAGGLAFFAGRVLVAETGTGLLAFDATNPTQTGSVWSIAQSGRFDLARRIANPQQRVFSFADIDWSEAGAPVLLTGVYASAKDGLLPGLFAWTLGKDGPTGKPPTDCLPCVSGQSAPDGAKPYRYIQGATRRDGAWYLSQSGDVAAITRYDGAPCSAPPPKAPLARCSLGLEDLHIPADGRCLRGLTENVSDVHKQSPRLLFEIPL